MGWWVRGVGRHIYPTRVRIIENLEKYGNQFSLSPSRSLLPLLPLFFLLDERILMNINATRKTSIPDF